MEVMNRPGSKEAFEKLRKERPPKKTTVQKKFIRPGEAAEMYSVSRGTVMKWAVEAGALLPIDGCKLIDPVALDKYLENWRVPGNVYY